MSSTLPIIIINKNSAAMATQIAIIRRRDSVITCALLFGCSIPTSVIYQILVTVLKNSSITPIIAIENKTGGMISLRTTAPFFFHDR